MKILYIASSGAPDGLYGGSVALFNLIKEIKPYAEIAVVFPDKGFLSAALEKLSVKCYFMPKYDLTTKPSCETFRNKIEYIPRYLRMLYKRKRAIKNIAQIILQDRPDIIHTNVGPLDIGYKLSLKFNIPHVWHIREYQDLDFNMSPYPSMNVFRKEIHNSNNHLIAITKDIFHYFEMDETKDKVIYDGVFDKKECTLNETKDNYFLFTGSIKEAKGVKFLLQAYIKYLQNGGTYKLYIAGAGGPEEYKNECIELLHKAKATDYVLFLGFRTDIYRLQSKAIAQIVASRFEGFGFITAEAMYNKCLVIGRNTAGTKEQFDNGLDLTGAEIGLRFKNIDELTESLLTVEHNGLNYYRPMVERAFDTVNQLYTNQECGAAVLKFYHSILETC